MSVRILTGNIRILTGSVRIFTENIRIFTGSVRISTGSTWPCTRLALRLAACVRVEQAVITDIQTEGLKRDLFTYRAHQRIHDAVSKVLPHARVGVGVRARV
jgi:hypothetical protein